MIRPLDQRGNSGGDFAFHGSEEVRTGRDGRYKTPAQLPVGNEFRVVAQAPGYEQGESGWVVAPPVTIGDLKLQRSAGRRAVAGRVVNSAGRPVAGAEVFQSGDGPRKTRGTTDNDGRFRIPGIPNAPAFIFVAKEGYHFQGRRVDPSDRSVDLTLRRLDEPPLVPLRPAAAPVSRDQERAIGRALIAEAKKSPGSVRQMAQQRQIPEITAMLDPNRVIEMIENQVLTAAPGLLTALAIARFEADPRQALEILDAIDPPDTAAIVALSLFDRLGATAAPEFRRELLERATRRAREIKDPGQAASLLAQVADRQVDLGDADRGSGLIGEVLVLAEKSHQDLNNPRYDLVPVLARIDLPVALVHLESLTGQPYQIDRIRTKITDRIAATDPAATRRILGMVEEHMQWWARHIACLRMAAKDLPAARALAAEDHDPIVEDLLPAMAARERAGSDREGARRLLREAVERLGKLGDSQAVRPSPAVALARLLPLAVRIDPDRAPDDFWLALSRRPPLSTRAESIAMMDQVRQQYLDLAELTVLVARYDRVAAEVVFAPVADRLVGLEDENWGLGKEGLAIFRAAGAFDARVAKAMLDGLPEDPAPSTNQATGGASFRHQSKAQARIALAEILGLPPGLRLRQPFLPGDAGWLGDFAD